MDKYTLTREDTVLMIIDIQERLAPAMPYGEQVIQKTNTLVSAAQKLELPVIVTEQYPKGLGKTVPEVSSNFGDVPTFKKMTFSGCTQEVLSALTQMGRKKIIIVGMETHVCVFQTVRDLLALEYRVFVVGDAVCSRSKENYQNALSQMTHMGAVVTNTEAVLFDLLKEAGTPIFKELSKLIK